MNKLNILVKKAGFECIHDAEAFLTYNEVPSILGICLTEGCDHTMQVEEDCEDQLCPACGQNTIVSLTELLC